MCCYFKPTGALIAHLQEQTQEWGDFTPHCTHRRLYNNPVGGGSLITSLDMIISEAPFIPYSARTIKWGKKERPPTSYLTLLHHNHSLLIRSTHHFVDERTPHSASTQIAKGHHMPTLTPPPWLQHSYHEGNSATQNDFTTTCPNLRPPPGDQDPNKHTCSSVVNPMSYTPHAHLAAWHVCMYLSHLRSTVAERGCLLLLRFNFLIETPVSFNVSWTNTTHKDFFPSNSHCLILLLFLITIDTF